MDSKYIKKKLLWSHPGRLLFCGQKGEEGSLEIPVRFSTRPETNEIEEMMNRSHEY